MNAFELNRINSLIARADEKDLKEIQALIALREQQIERQLSQAVVHQSLEQQA